MPNNDQVIPISHDLKLRSAHSDRRAIPEVDRVGFLQKIEGAINCCEGVVSTKTVT